jgi:hypothetical protein
MKRKFLLYRLDQKYNLYGQVIKNINIPPEVMVIDNWQSNDNIAVAKLIKQDNNLFAIADIDNKYDSLYPHIGLSISPNFDGTVDKCYVSCIRLMKKYNIDEDIKSISEAEEVI